MEGTSKHRTKHLDIISMNPCRSMLSGMLWPITGHYFFEGVSPVGGYHRIHLGTRFDRRISFLKAAMFFLPTPFDRDTAQKNSWLWGSRSPDLYYLWTPACSKLGTPAKMGDMAHAYHPNSRSFGPVGAVARFTRVLPPSLDPQLNPSEIFPWGDPGCLVVLGPGEFLDPFFGETCPMRGMVMPPWMNRDSGTDL
jgi:hypothetical protein